MKKINIIKSNKDFDRIIKTGDLIKNKYYFVYCENETNDCYKIGISVPKKLGNAVLRNKIKRQLKEIIDKNKDYIKKVNYIVIVRKLAVNSSFEEKEREFINVLKNL